MNRFLRVLAVLACVVGILHFSEPLPERVGTHGGDGYRWDFHPIVHAQQNLGQGGIGFNPPGSAAGGSGVFSSVTSPDFILKDTSGANTFTYRGGNHTANRVWTQTAGTDVLTTLDSGRMSLGFPVKIGTADWETEASVALEFVVRGDGTQATEVHAELGTDTTYAGFGVRNNRPNASGLTASGGLWVAYGSASAASFGGTSVADTMVLANAGVSSAGMAYGTTTIDPIWMFQQTATGSEPRLWFEDTCFALSDNVLGAFVRIDIASGSITGGNVQFFIYAFAAGNLQTRAGTMWFSAVNVSGTETCTVGNTAGTDLISITAVNTGTIGASFSCATTPTNGINLEVTSDSSLTTPTMAICYSVYKAAGVGAINPL